MEPRQLHLNFNLFGTGVHPGSWRWPGADPLSPMDIGAYVAWAQTAERGMFDAIFLADIPVARKDIATQVQASALDPTLIMTAIAGATEFIGLVPTLSTSFNQPFDLARKLQSLDIISNGRAGWNVVTSYTPQAALNFGASLAARDERYERAEEFVDVVTALWRSWHPGAVLADKVSGRFADTARLQAVNHAGKHFSVAGPLTLPPSPQGYPLLFQAGGSTPGMELAARTAHAVFSASTRLEDGIEYARSVRALTERRGRSPDSITILPGLVTTLGGTQAEARQRAEQLAGLADASAPLKGLAKRLGADPTELDLDSPVPERFLDVDLATVQTSHGFYKTVLGWARQGLTVRQIIDQGGDGHLKIVGTPEQAADLIERWFLAGAADGFNVMPDVMADGVAAFVDHVVPILQRRGLFRTQYRSKTLRGHYGVPLPYNLADTPPLQHRDAFA